MKRIKFIVLMVLVLIVCSACDGSVTRDIRHDGYNYGDEFTCKYFYPADKDDTSYLHIKYLTGSHIIDESGKIYEVSLGQAYAGGENCKVADTNVSVKAILDSTIFKGSDNKYYYLSSQNNVTEYSEVTSTDNNYYIYDLLLKPDDVVKVITGDSSSGLYYVLKDDGNVYGYIVSTKDRNSPPTITSNAIAYNQEDYGGAIIDFNYAGNSTSTFVRTANKIYRMYVNNASTCSKYADVNCTYDMREDDVLEKYWDRIITYNGSTLITDYHRVFSAS